MAELVLGLDLGPVSIGWALLDPAGNRLVAAGVRVFPEGVARDKGREVSKNAQRRVARMMRRQIMRRARRRRALRQALADSGFLPDVALLPRSDSRRDAWERDAFKGADPYELRARAVRELLAPFDLGRVLLHLSQRRGFKSNRKTDRARKNEDSKMLAEISELAGKVGDDTLGSYLSRLRGADRAKYHLVRVRGLHTRRDMLEREFDAIWSRQRRERPELFTEELGARLRELIFFQRPLRSPSPSLIGRCELEPRLPRCPRADRRAQLFRLYQEVNNLRVIDTTRRTERTLTSDEREQLLDLLRSRKELKFDDVRTKLFEQSDTIEFNLERGERTKLKGLPSDALFASKALLGKSWKQLSDDLRNRIVAGAIDEDEPRVAHALTEAGLDPALAPKLCDAELEDGYSSYSLHAIKKLLPHLAVGMPLTSRDASQPCALRNAGYLMPWEQAPHQQRLLPEPPAITNPIVRQALVEVRRVVNAILRELVYKAGHTLAHIHIELAREARGTAKQRAERTGEMRDRERERAKAADWIREQNICKVSRDAIDRYLLWQEQGKVCVYSGRPISIAQLLGGEIDLDHILPYSRSLDDSMMNKVVCFRGENALGPDRRGKGDRTPFEWLARTDAEKYEQVLARARRLPYPKQRRFYQETLELDDFFARQFVDTTYITTQVTQYVRCLGADVLAVKGSHTAELRRHWGLNEVLRSDAVDHKNRDDHRHHAVDAIVIALTSRSRLQQLASLSRRGGVQNTGEILNEPWPGFRGAVDAVVNDIIVSHKARRDVRGALHKDTVYGKTDVPGEFVVRKPLDALSPTEVLSIRDDAIRALVLARLRQFGITPGRGAGDIPAEVWQTPLTMPSGVPVRKVRIRVSDKSICGIRGDTAFVSPGSTHHLCLFEKPGETGGRYARFVSMLEAARRKRERSPIVVPNDGDAKFVMSLASNEMVLIRHNDADDYYRFETAASTSGQMWFRHHTFAGKSSDKRMQVSKRPGTFDGRKVLVDPIGRVRWAND